MTSPAPAGRWLALLALGAALLAAPAARAQDAQTLAHGIDLLQAGDYEHAAPIFFDVSENSGQQELQFRAEYYLALTLYKMGLYHSALYYDSTIIQEGPNHPYYRQAVVNTLDVMDAVGDKSTIPYMLDKYYNDAFAKLDKQVIDRINFIVALWDNGQRRMEDSVAFLEAVKPDATVYPRAQYLRGVQLAEQARAGDVEANERAAKYFERVRDMHSTDTVTYTDLPHLQELATLALARVRYAQERFDDAYKLYQEIPRFSSLWRDALFEGAYAAFRNDDYGHSLGLLLTLHAPIAGDQFVPESWLMEGILYYYNCFFDESKLALAKLQDVYTTQTGGQLKALIAARNEPDAYFNLLVNPPATGGYPANVRNELLRDESIAARRSYIAELAREGVQLQGIDSWHGSLLQKALLEAVSEQRNKLIQAAGTAIYRELRQMELTIEDLDGQAEIVKFEMAKREKDLLENGYDQSAVLATQHLNRPAVPVTGVEYWGFDGEFWPDELGYYQYTLKNACPAEKADTSAQ